MTFPDRLVNSYHLEDMRHEYKLWQKIGLENDMFKLVILILLNLLISSSKLPLYLITL